MKHIGNVPLQFKSKAPWARLAYRFCLVLLLSCAGPLAHAQNFDDMSGKAVEDQDVKRRGLHLYNVTTSTSYFTQAIPVDPSSLGSAGLSFGADVSSVTSATVGWTLPGRLSDLTIVYTPTYNASVNHPEWNRMNHFLNIQGRAGKPVARFGRWSLNVAGTMEANNFENFLFTPMQLSQVAATPATFDELAGALTSTSFSNNQLASLLTGAPMVNSPARLLFYGNRILTAGLSSTLTYAYSSRLSFHVRGGGSRLQPLETGTPSGTAIRPIQLRTTTAGASVGLSYLLNPRTKVSWSAESHRVFSPVMDAYINTSTVALSRIMGRHWFGKVEGGAGVIDPVRQSAAVPAGLQYVASGSLGYKMRAHTLLASLERSLSDSFAIGAGSTFISSGAWRWHRAGSPWSAEAAYSREQLESLGSGRLNTWRANTTISRNIGRQTTIIAQYAYSDYKSLFGQQPYNLSLDGVRVSLRWTPFQKQLLQ